METGARNERFSRKLSRSIVRVHFGIPCRITRYVTIPSELVKNSPFASRAIFPGYSVPCGEYRSDRCTSVEFFWRPRGGNIEKRGSLRFCRPVFSLCEYFETLVNWREKEERKETEAGEAEKEGKTTNKKRLARSFGQRERIEGRVGWKETETVDARERVGGTGERDGAEVGLRPSISRPVLRSFDREKLAIPRSSMRKFLLRILLIK